MKTRNPEHFTTLTPDAYVQSGMRKLGLLDTLVNIAQHSPEASPIDEKREVAIIVEALKMEVNPFTQLEQAVQLCAELPKSTVVDTIDPLIDSLSHDTLEGLLEQEAVAAKDAYGSALGVNEVRTCMDAWDVRRNDETEKLAEFAASHTGDSGSSRTFTAALKKAKEQEIPFDDALYQVNQEVLASFVPSHQHKYPWLHDASVLPPEDSRTAKVLNQDNAA